MAVANRGMMKQKFLSRTEEIELFRRWQEHGDKDARDKLLVSHLPFVTKMAKMMAGYKLPIDDLTQEGTIGLIHSLDKFDVSLGTRFATFARWHIRHYMQEYISRNLRAVKIPERAVKSPRTDAVDINPDVPLDAIVRPESPDLKLVDVLVDDRPNPEEALSEVSEERNLKMRIAKALRKLPTRSRAIIRSRYLAQNTETLEALSVRFQISRERVRQIEKQSLQMIRKALRSAESSV